MSRSRRNRPTWPTHKAKRHTPRTVPPWEAHEDDRPATPEAMARSLVARGLASPQGLGPISPRPRRTA